MRKRKKRQCGTESERENGRESARYIESKTHRKLISRDVPPQSILQMSFRN